jgi:transcriptional regulator with XRE-family HTH domain
MPRPRSTTAEQRATPTARGVRAAMAWADHDVAALAKATGISTRTIDRWRSGESEPNDDSAARVAAACGVPAALVVGEIDRLIAMQTVIDAATRGTQ